MNTVYCHVLDRQVDGNTCLEIVLVADREAKTSILPQGLEWNDKQREKCLQCPYHNDLEDTED